MDSFYAEVVSKWGLAARPALEGVSRGGLHAYRYAARHSERVACIYADTPVMDLKVWPLELPGGKKELGDAFRAYGFKDEADLRSFEGNPIDLLPAIATAKISLRHVISLDDQVVPPQKCTLEAKLRLEALGHRMEIVTVEHGTKESHGHHFPLPEAFASAQFIMRHADVLPAGREYFELRDGLANCRAKFEKAKTGRIAFVGGSITFNPGWRDELIRYFRQRFPETKFDFISTGIPSVGSLGHAFRLENDVLAGGPVDLVFVEAAVNDHNYDHLGKEACGRLALRGMEGVLRHLRRVNPMCDIVAMHFVHDMDLGTYAKKEPSSTIAAHEKVAAHYGCPSLDLSREVYDRIGAGEFTWAGDFRNLHPSPYGQRVYANSMTRMLETAFATGASPKPHPVPEPIDPGSFSAGRYGKLEEAKLSGGFVLDPHWTPKVRQEIRPGFGNCPALVADAPGAEMRYAFEGAAFGLFLAAGRDTGVIAYSVDGGPEKTLDTWSPWSAALHLPWPVVLAENLKPGKHEVVIRTTDQIKNRTALHVIHVLLN
jgi:sialidase-1